MFENTINGVYLWYVSFSVFRLNICVYVCVYILRSPLLLLTLKNNLVWQIERPLDIFLSHDWPRGIAKHGNTKRLLSQKSFLEREVRVPAGK